MTHSLGSLVVSIRALVSLIVTFFVAIYFKKFDCRKGITIGTCLTGVGFLVYAFAQSFPLFALGSILAGIGYGFGGSVGMTLLISRWYKGHYGKAAGFAAMGSGVAGALVPIVAVALIEHGDLSYSFLFQALVAFLITGLIALLLRNKPEDLQKKVPEGTNPISNAEKNSDISDMTGINKSPGKAIPKLPSFTEEKESVLSPFYHKLFILAMACVGAGSIGGVAYIGILSTSNGFDPWFTATVLSAVGIFLCVGKILSGSIMDKIGSKRGSLLFFGFFIAGLTICCSAPLHNSFLFMVGAIFFALGSSLGSTGISVWSIEFSHIANRPKVLRDFQTAYSAGGFLFNLLPGILMEITGTYVTTFTLLTVLLALSASIVFVVYGNTKEKKK